jgi:hypothetical protein
MRIFPYKLFEALVCKAIFVVRNVGFIDDIVKNGDEP